MREQVRQNTRCKKRHFSHRDPHFEQVVHAALTRHHGFTPTAFSSAQLRFLDVGLAPGDPDPLVPNVVSV
jgi:hypothetical protein